jgi:hypothetical protein
MQQMPMGQYQIIQPQLAGNAQYAVPQIAYNSQGQFVLQPANFAFQGSILPNSHFGRKLFGHIFIFKLWTNDI